MVISAYVIMAMNVWKPKGRMTKEQKKAWDAYDFAVKQEDRYMGSVFVNPIGQRQHEEKVSSAYARLKRTGLEV